MAGVGNFQPASCCCSCFFGLTFPLFVRQFFSCVKIFFFFFSTKTLLEGGGGEGGSKAREMVTDKSLRHGKN